MARKTKEMRTDKNGRMDEKKMQIRKIIEFSRSAVSTFLERFEPTGNYRNKP